MNQKKKQIPLNIVGFNSNSLLTFAMIEAAAIHFSIRSPFLIASCANFSTLLLSVLFRFIIFPPSISKTSGFYCNLKTALVIAI